MNRVYCYVPIIVSDLSALLVGQIVYLSWIPRQGADVKLGDFGQVCYCVQFPGSPLIIYSFHKIDVVTLPLWVTSTPSPNHLVDSIRNQPIYLQPKAFHDVCQLPADMASQYTPFQGAQASCGGGPRSESPHNSADYVYRTPSLTSHSIFIQTAFLLPVISVAI